MKVTNNTTEAVIAFTWDTRCGNGEDIKIEPGEAAEPKGPYIGEMGGGSCHLVTPGEVVVQNTSDDDNGFQVVKGTQLYLQHETSGITVRHHSEKRMFE